jgi:hypothetical protein
MADFVVEQLNEFATDERTGRRVAEFEVSLQFGWNERWGCVVQAVDESEALTLATSALREALRTPGPGRLLGANRG